MAEEDEQLVRLRNAEGLSWKAIANRMPSRSVESLKNRFLNFRAVKPLAIRFITEEDENLVFLREHVGLPWKPIAERMPGRTLRPLREHYHALGKAAPPGPAK